MEKETFERVLQNRLPKLAELSALIELIKLDIEPNNSDSDSNSDSNGIDLTIGFRIDGDWGFQTGDNSFTGGAYGYPIWGVGTVYMDSDSDDLAQDLIDQLFELSPNFDDLSEKEKESFILDSEPTIEIEE